MNFLTGGLGGIIFLMTMCPRYYVLIFLSFLTVLKCVQSCH